MINFVKIFGISSIKKGVKFIKVQRYIQVLLLQIDHGKTQVFITCDGDIEIMNNASSNLKEAGQNNKTLLLQHHTLAAT